MLETFALLPLFRWHISVRRDKNAFRHKICPKFTLQDFQAKTLTPPSSPNFNTFSEKLHRWQKFYTAADSDRRDKSHL